MLVPCRVSAVPIAAWCCSTHNLLVEPRWQSVPVWLMNLPSASLRKVNIFWTLINFALLVVMNSSVPLSATQHCAICLASSPCCPSLICVIVQRLIRRFWIFGIAWRISKSRMFITLLASNFRRCYYSYVLPVDILMPHFDIPSFVSALGRDENFRI